MLRLGNLGSRSFPVFGLDLRGGAVDGGSQCASSKTFAHLDDRACVGEHECRGCNGDIGFRRVSFSGSINVGETYLPALGGDRRVRGVESRSGGDELELGLVDVLLHQMCG